MKFALKNLVIFIKLTGYFIQNIWSFFCKNYSLHFFTKKSYAKK